MCIETADGMNKDMSKVTLDGFIDGANGIV